ncbi:hypothetical protein ACE3MQ_21295 [Paenibacillus lentus]|uniref:hypothetical protein n=1 Tax=Paenibacillus lentus TaxID=1338368 RepID=UPI0036526776
MLNGGVESIMSREDKDMLPISREKVEVEGLYTDEWGRSEYLYRGQEFPADLIMGSTEWKLTELAKDPAERDISDDFDNTGHAGKRRSGQVE